MSKFSSLDNANLLFDYGKSSSALVIYCRVLLSDFVLPSRIIAAINVGENIEFFLFLKLMKLKNTKIFLTKSKVKAIFRRLISFF